MADTKKPNEAQTGENKPGKFHYNPGNMAGEKAGIIKECDKQNGKENVERDGGVGENQVRRDQSQKNR
jgi:hypothetical protein